jgi:hypothetical protein
LEKLQLAINSRAASALPTEIKYLVTGTAHHSRQSRNSASPYITLP